ncbi:MAG: phosphatidylglycerol lysyltransferase domain-containing protein [Candidatus Limivicinus sp.]|nr:phosphatidylglycerol lysyltransferase domain-containing protein [Candidatus Limivicinus sp.]
MLEFKNLTLEDKAWVDQLVMFENSPSAGFNFGNIYLWNENHEQLVARAGGRMVSKLRRGDQTAFVFPIGRGPLAPAVEAIREFAAAQGVPLVLRGLTEKHVAQLEEAYPGGFAYTENETCADYMYLAEKLATYSGKALHGKKNHCNRFEAENDWDFVPLTRELIPDCLDMLDNWMEDNAQRLESSISREYDALLRAFAAYEKLGFEGGVLRIQGKIVGFSLGEFTSPDCFDVHFEKADGSINGAYPMVCRELTRQLMAAHPQLKYMNREEDMGLESLRRSKQSYKPEFMVRKFTARWKND